MTTIDRRGAAYNWMTEEAAGQVDVGGGWFVRATARQPQPDQPRYIELKLWERTDTGFRPGQQRLTLPIDAIPEMHRLLDEAARLSTWRWSESQPEAS